ncbi:unnamed protein product [Leptosia nina]|uniref:Uncharacterized protein n=1 Tax=Leptosia nina TaxID=320188 RepID=A0AAV1JXC7_9NEOP
MIIICTVMLNYTTAPSLKNKSISRELYITNWNGYKLPHPISVSEMKKILNKISLYRTLQYCPFANNETCLQVHYKSVVAKIIEDVVGLNKRIERRANQTITNRTSANKKFKDSEKKLSSKKKRFHKVSG